MYCTNCGKKIDSNNHYCTKCGKKIEYNTLKDKTNKNRKDLAKNCLGLFIYNLSLFYKLRRIF